MIQDHGDRAQHTFNTKDNDWPQGMEGMMKYTASTHKGMVEFWQDAETEWREQSKRARLAGKFQRARESQDLANKARSQMLWINAHGQITRKSGHVSIGTHGHTIKASSAPWI